MPVKYFHTHQTLVSQPSRFAKEYSASPGRGYGSGVIQVLKKLSSPQLSDVYQPARDQFNGRGSFGNGGAMRAAPFALAFPDLADVKRVSSGHFQAKITSAQRRACRSHVHGMNLRI